MPTTADAIRMRQHWRKMPDRRSASFYRRTSAGPPAVYGAASALSDLWHRDYRNGPHGANPGVYVVYSATLFLPKETNSTLATTAPPLPGDQIQDDVATTIPYTGKLWTIGEVEEAGALGVWKMACVAPAILSGIGLSVQIQSPGVTVTGSGLRQVDSWATVSTQAAWVQLTPTAADDYLARRSLRKLGTLYLPVPVTVTAQQVAFVAATGDRYTITAVRYPTDFATMQEIDVEIIP